MIRKKTYIFFILFVFILIPFPSCETKDQNNDLLPSTKNNGPFPLTRESVQQILRKTPPPNEQQLTVETLKGCVSVPAKKGLQKLFVGVNFTGEFCTVTVKPQNTVAVSFLGNIDIPLANTSTPDYPTDIFLNQIEDNGVVIVQHVKGKVVSVTHTVYDKKGYVVYGGSGKGNFIKACIFDPIQTTKTPACN